MYGSLTMSALPQAPPQKKPGRQAQIVHQSHPFEYGSLHWTIKPYAGTVICFPRSSQLLNIQWNMIYRLRYTHPRRIIRLSYVPLHLLSTIPTIVNVRQIPGKRGNAVHRKLQCLCVITNSREPSLHYWTNMRISYGQNN